MKMNTRFFAESLGHWYQGGPKPSTADLSEAELESILEQSKQQVIAYLGEERIPVGTEHTGMYNVNNAYGTPDDAIAYLERYWEKTQGFGCILHLAINWPRFEHVKRSAELFARYVMPKFTGRNLWREASFGWITEHSLDFAGARKSAANQAIDAYFGKKAG